MPQCYFEDLSLTQSFLRKEEPEFKQRNMVFRQLQYQILHFTCVVLYRSNKQEDIFKVWAHDALRQTELYFPGIVVVDVQNHLNDPSALDDLHDQS